MTQNEIALKILNMGKDGYKNDAEGFEKLNQANALIENHLTEQLILSCVIPRFLKTKYTLEELDKYVHEMSCRTDRHIHRSKLEDIEKLIRWRRRYDALNEA
jgi:hypothetical protein